MAEPITIYKLIILYMLSQVDFPLGNTKISNFFLDKEYTTYFTIQQVLNDLLDSELIVAESTHNNTNYRITASGRETLDFFEDKISEAIRQDIREYFSQNQIEMKKEADISADYYRTPQHNYAVHCPLRQKNIPVIDLTLTVKNTEMAEAVCKNWQEQSPEVYACLMDMLVK